MDSASQSQAFSPGQRFDHLDKLVPAGTAAQKAEFKTRDFGTVEIVRLGPADQEPGIPEIAFLVNPENGVGVVINTQGGFAAFIFNDIAPVPITEERLLTGADGLEFRVETDNALRQCNGVTRR